uniref:Uncharacterized protein n=1 Tax=Vitrella brassicaformis TaxID=1169539 RepID=A0A7S1JMS3_9ALVE
MYCVNRLTLHTHTRTTCQCNRQPSTDPPHHLAIRLVCPRSLGAQLLNQAAEKTIGLSAPHTIHRDAQGGEVDGLVLAHTAVVGLLGLGLALRIKAVNWMR